VAPQAVIDYCSPTQGTATITQAVAFASALVRTATAQTLSLVTDDTVQIRGGAPKLLLPEYPVVSVKSVAGKYYSTTTDPFFYEIYDTAALYGPIPAGVWVQDASGRLLLPVGSNWPPVVQITYTHGYTTIPDDLQMVTTSVAARMLDNPMGDRNTATGGVSQGLAPTALTAMEQMVVRRYRRKTSQ
jgi:hypothetical protein